MPYVDAFDEDDDIVTESGDDSYEEEDETLEELTTDSDGHIDTHRNRTREDEFEPEQPDFDEEFTEDFDASDDEDD